MKKIYILLFIFFLLPLSLYSLDSSNLKNGKKLYQTEFQELIEDSIIKNQLSEIDRLSKLYPASFSSLDFSRSYYDAGICFYTNGRKMLALKAFMKGYDAFQGSLFKSKCAYYTAKILYQNANRPSALFYINRALELGLEAARKQSGTNTEELDEISKLKRRIRWEYISRLEGLPDDSISAIEFDGDDLWLGLWTGGAVRFTRSANILTLFKGKGGGLISKHVRDIKVFQNRVWTGCYDGLFFFDKKRSFWEREKGELSSITVKKLRVIDRELYAATLGKGLFKFNSNRGQWQRFFYGALYVTDILQLNQKIYIATLDKGLFAYEKGLFKIVFTNIPVKCLSELNGTIWAGTHGHGIYLVDQKGGIKKYTTENGLSSDYVESIEKISQQMLIGTLGGGVSVFNNRKKEFSYLSILDGLPSNDVMRITIEKDKVWFGTLSGGIGILLTENLGDI
jgi:hypothetical protein